MIDKYDARMTPTKMQLIEYTGAAKALLTEFCAHVEGSYKVKESIDYSKCTAIPGWNIKYKLKGKSFCVIYPYEDYFSIMVTLAPKDLEKYQIVKTEFGELTQRIIAEAKPFNNTKWIITEVREQGALRDALKLAALKGE